MEGTQAIVSSTTLTAEEILPLVRKIPLFANASAEDLNCLGEVELVHAAAGSLIFPQGETRISFWVLVDGEIQVTKLENDGETSELVKIKTGETFGEVPLLGGMATVPGKCEAVTDTTLLRVEADAFWRVMATCPVIRSGVLSNMARRHAAYQAHTLHREKLISLGTLAAGLMHELNNPGTAARRAASQLRENLIRLQEISLRLNREPLTIEQKDCMRQLQEEALAFQKPKAMGTLEQADAEDELLTWLEEIGVENAWKMAPTLVAIGWHREDIECAQRAFSPALLSNALNWLDSLISSVQLVGTIEESISRVTDLVVAVKKYAYDDKDTEHLVDIHDSIQSTLTILGHKFRHKELTIEKNFAAGLPKVKTCGTGLSQVWTNILDNAIDASPEKGTIGIRTWVDGKRICIGIADHGSGIAEEHRAHIFEPFFTTKAVGVGTGLGLDIAHRIVTGHYLGHITFTSEPGNTEFIVELPIGA
jgi:signal transduction histidine kinase